MKTLKTPFNKSAYPELPNIVYFVLDICGKNALFIPRSAKPNAGKIKDIEQILIGLFCDYSKFMKNP